MNFKLNNKCLRTQKKRETYLITSCEAFDCPETNNKQLSRFLMIYPTQRGRMHKHLNVNVIAHYPCFMKVSKFHTKDNIAIRSSECHLMFCHDAPCTRIAAKLRNISELQATGRDFFRNRKSCTLQCTLQAQQPNHAKVPSAQENCKQVCIFTCLFVPLTCKF